MEGKAERPPTSYPMPPIKGRKPHVVLLHGTACNTAVLRTQLRELTSGWDDVDLTFIEGSNVITQPFHPIRKIINDAFGRQETNLQYLETHPADGRARLFGRFGYALAKFDEQVLKLDKPVDFLLGFSQGALFASLLAARNLKRADAPAPYRGVILLNPPNPESLSTRAPCYFGEKLATPAFICKGLADDVVPGGFEGMKEVYKSFELAEHPFGHQPLPGDVTQAKDLARKIRAFVKLNC